jgi:hypothetical protein
VAGAIRLPSWMLGEPETLIRSFLHELQHAADYLVGLDLGIEEMERRARRAERLEPSDLDALITRHWR